MSIQNNEAIVILKENNPEEAVKKYDLLLWYNKKTEYNGSIGWFVMKLKCSFLNFNQILIDMKKYEDTLAIFVNFDEQIIMWFFKP